MNLKIYFYKLLGIFIPYFRRKLMTEFTNNISEVISNILSNYNVYFFRSENKNLYLNKFECNISSEKYSITVKLFYNKDHNNVEITPLLKTFQVDNNEVLLEIYDLLEVLKNDININKLADIFKQYN